MTELCSPSRADAAVSQDTLAYNVMYMQAYTVLMRAYREGANGCVVPRIRLRDAFPGLRLLPPVDLKALHDKATAFFLFGGIPAIEKEGHLGSNHMVFFSDQVVCLSSNKCLVLGFGPPGPGLDRKTFDLAKISCCFLRVPSASGISENR